LGRPDVGARWLSALRLQQPNVDFWLADQAGIDVFVAHTTDLDVIHGLSWTHFNQYSWSQSDDSVIPPSDSTSYLTYRATCAVLDDLVKEPSANPLDTTAGWELQSQPIVRPKSE
jgi:hypothetical protein